MPLFEKVLYHISQSLGEHTRHEISRILDINGATEVPIDRATHILSDTIEFEGCDTLRKDVVCVTPYWVERSMELGQLQNTKYFSADRDMFFSGVVATSADLPVGDKEVIASGILAQGGAWREGLTRDVTHLFVTNTRSQKYQTAMHFRESAHIIILLPQWFDQCWSTQMRLPPDVFQFPDPPYLRNDHDIASYKAQMLVKKHTVGDPHVASGLDKDAMFRTIHVSTASSPPAQRPRNVWQGRSILLSPSLGLNDQRRESLETRIRSLGGVIVTIEDEDETLAVEQADILITRHRTGPAYAAALDVGKTIGTLTWLFYVERTGILSRPRDQLLHYPVRNRPIAGFADHEITVTNYQGEAREYIKKLIEIMGAKFTPTMSGRNTIVIAAYKSGNKTSKAEEWSVPVVTHKWLEDCFVEWRNLTPAQKKYLDYAPGVNYGVLLGERGVGRVGLAEDPELLPETWDGPLSTKKSLDKGKTGGDKSVKGKKTVGEGFNGTATSLREAIEVEEVEEVLDAGKDADDLMHAEVREEPLVSPGKVGPPRGVKKTMNDKAVTSPFAKSKSKPSSGILVGGDKNSDVMPVVTKGSPRAAASTPRKTPSSPLRELKSDVAALMKIGPPVKQNAKSMPNARPMVVFENDESVVNAVTPMKIGLSPKSKSVSKPTPRAKSPVESDSDNESVRVSKSKSISSKATPDRRSGVLSRAGDEESTDGERHKGDKGKSRRTQASSAEQSSDAPQAQSMPKGKAKSTTPKNKAPKTPSKVPSKSTPKAPTPKAKAKAYAVETDSDDEIQIISPTRTVEKTYGRAHKKKIQTAPQPSPNHIVSVELPSPRSLLKSVRPRAHSPAQSPSSSSRPQTSPVVHHESATTREHTRRSTARSSTAHEAKTTSSVRGRHSSATLDTSSKLSTSSPRRQPTESPHKVAVRRAASPASDISSPSVRQQQQRPREPKREQQRQQRGQSQRSAAAAASRKLHDEVMPDMMNYQSERRKEGRSSGEMVSGGRRRKQVRIDAQKEEEEENEEAESDGGAPAQKKRRVVTGSEKDEDSNGWKKRGVVESKDSDAPPVRFVTHVKNPKRRVGDEEGNDGGSETGGNARKRLRVDKTDPEHGFQQGEKIAGRSSWDPKKIRILTTKVVMPDHLEKALTKLGMRFTEKPQECTHLVAQGLSRTEKLLCALPNTPFVLNAEWLFACAEAKQVVAESGYALHDPDMEHKHQFKLAEALERARELKRKKEKLLQGHFFYITPHVVPEFKLLKNVLQALGGECRQSTPTLRNLSETRHVISGWKDEELWRPLVKGGITVYSHELILSAAFTQVVDWDGDDKILARGAAES